MAKPRRTATVLAAAVVLVFLTAEECKVPDTMGTRWQMDGSACASVPADAVIQVGGAIDREYGKEAPPGYPGHPGCDRAFVIDYLLPPIGAKHWVYTWIHVATRLGAVDEAKCKQLWTSLRVYGYKRGHQEPELLKESYRKATWTSGHCDFGQPDNIWLLGDRYERVRAASQHGWGLAFVEPHYSYFVTNSGGYG